MISTIQELQNYLLTRVPKDFKKIYIDNWGLDNVKRFLESLDNPQDRQPTTHISGTSGKGSTAYFASMLFQKQGFKVGLHVSPYVVDFGESFQINSQLPNLVELINCFNIFIQKYEKFDAKLTYHELKTCFAFYFFYQQKVDFVIMEAGMGGTYDSTNCVNREDKICLINQIGYDHQEFLGTKISQIADEESGIINQGNTVVFAQQIYKNASKIITKKAKKLNAKLHQVFNSKEYDLTSLKYLPLSHNTDGEVASIFNIENTQGGTYFDYSFDEFELYKLQIKNLGSFQTINSSLAITGLILASKIHNFALNKDDIFKALLETIFPARMQLVDYNNLKLIVDGGHNQQKINALVNNLKEIFPDQKFTILCGFSGQRNPKPMLKKLIEVADQIIITQFTNQGLQIVGKSSVASEILIKSLVEIKFTNYKTFEDLNQAWQYFIKQTDTIGLATGSFYLCSEILKNTANNEVQLKI